MTLVVTAVFHFIPLVTHSSPESLYLTDYVKLVRFVYSSPLANVFRVTSESALQTSLFQSNTLCEGDEWVTSEMK